MSVEVAKRYFEIMDSTDHGTDDVMELYGDDPTVISSQNGVVRGRDAIREFYELNAERFVGGAHVMERFHQDGDTVICEGTLDGETAAGRSFEGVPLCDIMQFNGDNEIVEFRAYLDYSHILSELPEETPNVRED